MTNNNLTDERLSVLIRVAMDSLELYEMELPVIDDVMLALAELQQRRAAMLQGGQPVNQTYNLPELIEGMEVSIDVSTCDADLGNRYFGTVTEASELDTAKNGYILLVQDAEPNFDVNGNYPVTPDGWISCSELMPEETGDIIVVSDGIVMSGISYSRRDGFYIAALEYDDDEPIDGVTHWMPLPEPPQEVK
nr:DUF551 domain-containing protein [Escherichia coli]